MLWKYRCVPKIVSLRKTNRFSTVYCFYPPRVTFQLCIFWASNRQTRYFTVAIVFITKNNTLFQKTRAKLAATEGSMAAPVVADSEKKHVVSLCKFRQSWKMY